VVCNVIIPGTLKFKVRCSSYKLSIKPVLEELNNWKVYTYYIYN